MVLVNFQFRCVLLLWIIVWQRPTVLALGMDGCCLNIFLAFHISFLLWEMAWYRLKYCLNEPLNPNNHLTEKHEFVSAISFILFNELFRFLGEIETDNLTVSNSEIITFDFTVSKNRIFVK